MSVLRKEIYVLHEVEIAAAQIIEDVNKNDLWGEPKHKAKLKTT